MKLLLVTASNNNVKECRDMCAESMARYCTAHPKRSYAVHAIPERYERRPGWFKIGLIAILLPMFDYVLHIDPDALVIGKADFKDIIQPATLNIAKDAQGINCGVMAWRNCPEAFQALAKIEELYPRYKSDSWNEQAALISFIDRLEVFYQPKSVWNAYPLGNDVTPETMVVHWPGIEGDRAPLMREFLTKENYAS